jgi:hypothetical protein
MYIGSTYYYMDTLKNRDNIQPSWDVSEKYENCENFYQQITGEDNKNKFFHKKNKNIS